MTTYRRMMGALRSYTGPLLALFWRHLHAPDGAGGLGKSYFANWFVVMGVCGRRIPFHDTADCEE